MVFLFQNGWLHGTILHVRGIITRRDYTNADVETPNGTDRRNFGWRTDGLVTSGTSWTVGEVQYPQSSRYCFTPSLVWRSPEVTSPSIACKAWCESPHCKSWWEYPQAFLQLRQDELRWYHLEPCSWNDDTWCWCDACAGAFSDSWHLRPVPQHQCCLQRPCNEVEVLLLSIHNHDSASLVSTPSTEAPLWWLLILPGTHSQL